MTDQNAVKSVHDSMAEVATSIKEMLTTLIREHSTIIHSRGDDDDDEYGTVILAYVGYGWKELTQAGKQVQARVLEEYRYFASLMQALLSHLPEAALAEFAELDEAILRIIKQDPYAAESSKDKVLSKALKSLDAQMELLGRLYNYDQEDYIVVPDTNILLAYPDLDKWSFPNVPTFTIYLTPTVLEELDFHKVNHRNEEVRKKAIGLTNRIGDYRRRGRLSEGVTLRNGISRIASVAIEPDFGRTLGWLSQDNADDRLLASFLEIMRKNPRTRCVLLTRDGNLANKADFARLPVGDPPETA